MRTYVFYVDTGFAGCKHEEEVGEETVRAEMGLEEEEDQISVQDLEDYAEEFMRQRIDYGFYVKEE